MGGAVPALRAPRGSDSLRPDRRRFRPGTPPPPLQGFRGRPGRRAAGGPRDVRGDVSHGPQLRGSFWHTLLEARGEPARRCDRTHETRAPHAELFEGLLASSGRVRPELHGGREFSGGRPPRNDPRERVLSGPAGRAPDRLVGPNRKEAARTHREPARQQIRDSRSRPRTDVHPRKRLHTMTARRTSGVTLSTINQHYISVDLMCDMRKPPNRLTTVGRPSARRRDRGRSRARAKPGSGGSGATLPGSRPPGARSRSPPTDSPRSSTRT